MTCNIVMKDKGRNRKEIRGTFPFIWNILYIFFDDIGVQENVYSYPVNA